MRVLPAALLRHIGAICDARTLSALGCAGQSMRGAAGPGTDRNSGAPTLSPLLRNIFLRTVHSLKIFYVLQTFLHLCSLHSISTFNRYDRRI